MAIQQTKITEEELKELEKLKVSENTERMKQQKIAICFILRLTLVLHHTKRAFVPLQLHWQHLCL